MNKSVLSVWFCLFPSGMDTLASTVRREDSGVARMSLGTWDSTAVGHTWVCSNSISLSYRALHQHDCSHHNYINSLNHTIIYQDNYINIRFFFFFHFYYETQLIFGSCVAWAIYFLSLFFFWLQMWLLLAFNSVTFNQALVIAKGPILSLSM